MRFKWILNKNKVSIYVKVDLKLIIIFKNLKSIDIEFCPKKCFETENDSN